MILRILMLMFISTFIIACSPVDSLSVFDDKQVDALLHEHSTSKPANEMVKLDLPNKNAWEKVDLSSDQRGAPVALIPLNETIENWTQKISTQSVAILSVTSPSAHRIAMRDIDSAKQNCERVNARVLTDTNKFIVYRLEMGGCFRKVDQVQVVKAFNGSDAVYIVRYSVRGELVNAGQVEKMSRVIANAQLVRNPVSRLASEGWHPGSL